MIEMEKLKRDTLDQLSQLPNSLILEILSYLDMRDVIRTTLLSKRWKYLWTTIPCLIFEESGNAVQIRNFVSRVLTLWRGNYLRKFSICLCSGAAVAVEPSLFVDINLWVLFAKERKVDELCISLCMNNAFYCAPQCLYECSSVKKLLLFGCFLRIRGNVHWVRLNSLKLSACAFSEGFMNQVVSSSPQLETFMLECCSGFQNISIRSSSMKMLSICSSNLYKSSVLTIWAPNLEALNISEMFSGSNSTYVLTDVSSLTEAYLDLKGSKSAVVGEALCQILPAIQHVRTVKLSADCFKMLEVMKDRYSVPPLLNVELLKIESGLTEVSELVVLLENFPNLKMLIIVWTLAYKDYEKSFKFIDENCIPSQANTLKSNLLHLRTVRIIWYKHHASIFQFIEFLLKHSPVIEKMVIQKIGSLVSKDMILAAQKVIMSLQISFPSVELVFC